MSDTYRLAGGYSTTPALGSPSGQPSLSSPIDESASLIKKSVQEFALTTDLPVSVPLGGLSQAQVVNIKSVGGKVRVRLTSSDGTDQSVPCDPVFIGMMLSTPITAIDLTRPTGVEIIVTVFLGQTS